MALVFGVLTLSLLANQVATGLALTIFGIGLSALVGSGFVGVPVEPAAAARHRRPVRPARARAAPVRPRRAGLSLGRADRRRRLVPQAHAAAAWSCARSARSDVSAHSIGYDVIRVRYMAVLFGGAMAGLGGAYPVARLHADVGRGHDRRAAAGSRWRWSCSPPGGPWRLLLGAYLFGGVTILQLYAQGWRVRRAGAGDVDAALPRDHRRARLIISAGPWTGRLDAPACLGKPFRPAT